MLKDCGHIPAGCEKLKPLLYPFYLSYPFKIWSKYRWWKNSNLSVSIRSLDKKRKWITVVNRLGAPGDTLITSNVIRCIKINFPKLKINCITPHAELIRLDPNIDSINQPETFYSFDSTYWELIVRKEKSQNIIEYNMQRLGIDKYEYKAKFYLSEEEKEWAKQQTSELNKPLLAICTKSKEPVKNWPEANWLELIQNLKDKFSIIQLGDDLEPGFDNVIRYAGKFSMRESAAMLSLADFFIGPDSLLMHIANGLNIQSIIIFGGSRSINCFGYPENTNLSNNPECSPCWIHSTDGKCNESLKCLHNIGVPTVFNSLKDMIKK
jgi:ADP-heptose:LPS heptosyltransferase